MGLYQFVLISFLILTIIRHNEVSAACNVCQENGVACVNETSFQLCFGGMTPHTLQTFTCMNGLECTNLPNICYQIGVWTPSCEETSKCGICNGNNVFACTSRTTFAFCFGSTNATNVVGTCPTGYVCDYLSNEICVPRVGVTKITCDRDAA